MRKTWLIGFLIAAVLISGCTYGPKTETQSMATQTASPVPTRSSNTVNVEIKGFAFNPDNITISRGTTVTWTNADTMQHTVTGIGNDIDSQILSQGQTYSFTFNDAGTFEYQCHIHPSMLGKVIVT